MSAAYTVHQPPRFFTLKLHHLLNNVSGVNIFIHYLITSIKFESLGLQSSIKRNLKTFREIMDKSCVEKHATFVISRNYLRHKSNKSQINLALKGCLQNVIIHAMAGTFRHYLVNLVFAGIHLCFI